MPRSSGSNDQLTLRFQSDGLSRADSVGRIKAALNDVAGADVGLDAGLAVGTDTDIAIKAADVALMSGDLRGVVNTLELSRRTMNNIRHNLILIPLAIGALYPFFGTLLSPTLAAGAMALSSVFVFSNALHLRFINPTIEARK